MVMAMMKLTVIFYLAPASVLEVPERFGVGVRGRGGGPEAGGVRVSAARLRRALRPGRGAHPGPASGALDPACHQRHAVLPDGS